LNYELGHFTRDQPVPSVERYRAEFVPSPALRAGEPDLIAFRRPGHALDIAGIPRGKKLLLAAPIYHRYVAIGVGGWVLEESNVAAVGREAQVAQKPADDP
jgi:hypothetical protein